MIFFATQKQRQLGKANSKPLMEFCSSGQSCKLKRLFVNWLYWVNLSVASISPAVAPCRGRASHLMTPPSPRLPQTRPGSRPLSFRIPFTSLSPFLIRYFPVAWFIIIHSPPLVKRIRLAINARLDKAGVAVREGEGPTEPRRLCYWLSMTSSLLCGHWQAAGWARAA